MQSAGHLLSVFAQQALLQSAGHPLSVFAQQALAQSAGHAAAVATSVFSTAQDEINPANTIRISMEVSLVIVICIF